MSKENLLFDDFDLTPDPKILIALTHTPMQPLDSLCELIDNAIDSFQAAKLLGYLIEKPLIVIDLPTISELNRNVGLIRIRDNGPGLTKEMAQKAIKAGFTGNNPYDSLGLFGMGFNISTGKLGRVTRLTTARKDDENMIEVVINLEKIEQTRNYKVPAINKEKSQDFRNGTLIEIFDWWPVGNPNSNFIRKLVQYGMKKVREELGRRYATIIRNNGVRIMVNSEACEAFDHCVWSEKRFVERRNHGKIPALFRFNESIGSQKRCISCTALIAPESNVCQACESSSFRTIEERIRGWVGIQRFDDSTEFGIDIIRNGRAIRIGEKNAFFEFVDEFKKTIKDYPIDSNFGRIIGEVHLDHVPVDYLKEDFQRLSPEWQRAMLFIRGESSLQPTQPNAELNQSPIYKLFQGYRKVKKFGRTDLYMGYWNKDNNQPQRISRDVEKEYFEKFKLKVPGYYEDTEWWNLVEAADTPPLEDLVECPSCNAQNLVGHDICGVCDYILLGKECLNAECDEIIPQSALSCPLCGLSQIPEIEEPWNCAICGSKNNAKRELCQNCSETKGTENRVTIEYLLKNSNKDDELSFLGCSIGLADGSYNSPIDIEVYSTRLPIIRNGDNKNIPIICFKDEKIQVFVDKNHSIFKIYRLRPEHLISTEIALYLYDSNRRLSGQQYFGLHSISNIQWNILEARWSDELKDGPENVRSDIENFFKQLKVRLPEILEEECIDIFNEVTEEQKKKMINNIMDLGKDISKLGEMKVSGEYLLFVDEDTVVEIFRKFPSKFFDGVFWELPFINIEDLTEAIVDQIQNRIRLNHVNCLEDISSYLKYRTPESLITQRARMSLDFLQQRMN